MKRLMENRTACALLALLAADYIAFLTADLFFAGLGPFSAFAKYLSILICLATAVSLHPRAWNRRDSALLIAALTLTCVADLFLLLLGRPIPGLLAFCAVHLIYIRRYRPAIFRPAAAASLSAAAVCLAAGFLIPGFPAKLSLGGLYGALILTATVCGFRAPLPRTDRRLVSAGMVLFLLCDAHVALVNTLSAGNPYYPYAAFLMWFFYLPAQALLALSGLNHAPGVAATRKTRLNEI